MTERHQMRRDFDVKNIDLQHLLKQRKIVLKCTGPAVQGLSAAEAEELEGLLHLLDYLIDKCEGFPILTEDAASWCPACGAILCVDGSCSERCASLTTRTSSKKDQP